MKFTLMLLLAIFSLSASAQGFLPEYTILHFGNGFNDLDGFIKADINQMEIIGSTRKIQVVAQLGSQEALTARRYFIQKDNDPHTITSPVVQDLGLVDMGDWKTLADFVIWGIKNYPAKRYFVIVGGHGDGWRQEAELGPRGLGPVRMISPDFNTNNQITTLQLARAFEAVRAKTGKKIEIFGADACLMGSIEVATQLNNGVKFMVASQEIEPGEGWVYQELLKRLNRESDMSGKNISRLAAKSYIEGYRSLNKKYYTKQKLTISASDIAEAVKFSGKLRKLTEMLRTSLSQANLKKLASQSGGFYDRGYVDIGYFLSNLSKLPLIPAHRVLVEDLIKNYESSVVIRDHASSSFDFSTGLHVWMPRKTEDAQTFLPAYSQLFFNRLSGWGSLFNAF